jgi:hypothetical protein
MNFVSLRLQLIELAVSSAQPRRLAAQAQTQLFDSWIKAEFKLNMGSLLEMSFFGSLTQN